MTDRDESATGLIQLEKGDPNNLVGPVIIYATVNGERTFREKATDPEGNQSIEDLLRRIQISFEEEADRQKDTLFSPGYCEGSEEDLDAVTAGVDVVYAGEFSNLRRAELAMIGADMVYKSLFLSQQDRGKSYEEGSCEDLMKKGILPTTLSWTYIDSIVQSIKAGDMEARNRALEEFLKFCEDSPLEDASYSFAALLVFDERNEELQDLYLKLINAVATQQDTSNIRHLIAEALPATPIESRFSIEARKKMLRENGLRI